MTSKILVPVFLIFLSCASGFSQAATESAPSLPASWMTLPEDVPAAQRLERVTGAESVDPAAEAGIDAVYSATAAALDSSAPFSAEKDVTRWHLAELTADLAVTAQGLLGALTVKGTPAVSVFWRLQGPARPASEKALGGEAPGIAIDASSSPDQISEQIEPALRAALATGKVKDESALRGKLLKAATEFQDFVRALDTSSDSQWWVSGFRFDFSVDASGNVMQFGTVGADLRFRFEWKRMMPSRRLLRPLAASSEGARVGNQLEALARSIAGDLEAASADSLGGYGFKAYAFRVGIGMTASGKIGVAKSDATAIGHLNFSRDVAKPVVRPAASADKSSDSGEILLVDSAPSEAHVQFAQSQGLLAEKSLGDAAYRIERERFRSGLGKAIRMGSFFAKHAAKARSASGWHIYELKVDYDMSVTGDLGLAAFGVPFSGEIAFYNENF